MATSRKAGVIIWNPHRNEWEVWYESEVIGHGTDLAALQARYPLCRTSPRSG